MLYQKVKTKPMHLLPVGPGYSSSWQSVLLPQSSTEGWMTSMLHHSQQKFACVIAFTFLFFFLISNWLQNNRLPYAIFGRILFCEWYASPPSAPHSFPCPASLLPPFPPALLTSTLFRCLPHILHLEHLSLVTGIPFLAFIHIFSHPDMHT